MKKFFVCMLLIFTMAASASCTREDLKKNDDKTKAGNVLNRDEDADKGALMQEKSGSKDVEIEPFGNALPEKLYGYTAVNEYLCDLNGDGSDEKITLYSDAQKDGDELMLNDGNNWTFTVFDTKNSLYFVLFDEYVQLGNVYFQVADYYENGKTVPSLLLYKISGAEIEILKYVSGGEKKYKQTGVYNTSSQSKGGINLKFSSIPE